MFNFSLDQGSRVRFQVKFPPTFFYLTHSINGILRLPKTNSQEETLKVCFNHLQGKYSKWDEVELLFQSRVASVARR